MGLALDGPPRHGGGHLLGGGAVTDHIGRKEYEGDRSGDRGERAEKAEALEQERRRDPGPSGTQYEKDKRDSKLRNILSGVLLFLTLILAGLAVANTFISAERSEQKDEDIRESQFRVCVNTANELRDDVRDEFVALKEQVLIPVFSGVAQTIQVPPPNPARTILVESVDYLERRVKSIDERIPDLNCLIDYPPLEGQTYPQELLDANQEKP